MDLTTSKMFASTFTSFYSASDKPEVERCLTAIKNSKITLRKIAFKCCMLSLPMNYYPKIQKADLFCYILPILTVLFQHFIYYVEVLLYLKAMPKAKQYFICVPTLATEKY
jgi:hypothetical protein